MAGEVVALRRGTNALVYCAGRKTEWVDLLFCERMLRVMVVGTKLELQRQAATNLFGMVIVYKPPHSLDSFPNPFFLFDIHLPATVLSAAKNKFIPPPGIDRVVEGSFTPENVARLVWGDAFVEYLLGQEAMRKRELRGAKPGPEPHHAQEKISQPEAPAPSRRQAASPSSAKRRKVPKTRWSSLPDEWRPGLVAHVDYCISKGDSVLQAVEKYLELNPVLDIAPSSLIEVYARRAEKKT